MTDTEEIIQNITSANVELNQNLKKTLQLIPLDWNIVKNPDAKEILMKILNEH